MKSKATLRDNLIYLAVGLIAAGLMSWLIVADLSRQRFELILRIFVLVGACGGLVFGLVMWGIRTRKDELRKFRFWTAMMVTIGLFGLVEWRQARPSLATVGLMFLATFFFGVLLGGLRCLDSKHPHDKGS